MNYKKILTISLLTLFITNPVSVFAIQNKNEARNINKIDYVNLNWWKNFNDPYLEDYIMKALEYNKDLQIASLTIDEYSQFVKIQFGQELPTVGIGAGYVGQQLIGNKNNNNLLSPDFRDYIFTLPLFVQYELDIYGKNHNKTTAVKELKTSVAYQEKSANISVISMVASTYINIVQLDKLISLQKDIVDYRKVIYELMEEQHKYGYASLQDTIGANKAYTSAKIQLTELEKQSEIALNALAVLIGDSPENSSTYERSSFDLISANIDLPDSIDSEIIINRPDVQAIEAHMRKSAIDIRIARKELLPSIKLNGAIMFNAIKQGKLIDNSFGLLSLAPMVTHSLFTGGQKLSNLKLKKIGYEKMLKNYEKTNLMAIQEINDSLVKIKYDTKQDKDNAQKLALEQQNEILARESYDAGAISMLEYTQYKELLAIAEHNKTQSTAKCLIDAISLYKATGAKI